jgi:DNA-binding transcriptional regulator GbsR (MarR family)
LDYKIRWRDLRVAFISPKPLAGDEIVSRLDISLGVGSQGLKPPWELGAVNAGYSPGARRGHLAADLELTKFTSVFMKEELRPPLERALEGIHHIEWLLGQLSTAERELKGERLRKAKRCCLGRQNFW